VSAARRRRRRVAVLGAGIMGCSVALFLARRRWDVVLVDAAPAPMDRASRWNEGKIHLGYLYAADPTLATARSVLPGGLAFRPLVEELIGEPLEGVVTPEDDVFLVHRDSVVDAEAMARYVDRLTKLVRVHPDASSYLADASGAAARALAPSELEAIADERVVRAGFRVPERSVATGWVADRLAGAVRACDEIDLILGTRVRSVERAGAGWRVISTPPREVAADAVVNALWEGRLAVDASAAIAPEPGWSHRHRLALFVRTAAPTDLPSAVVATGPFGDVKNFNGRDLYMSWYGAGLTVEGEELAPPEVPALDAPRREAVREATVRGLAEGLPRVPGIVAEAEDVRVEGGWVFAFGRGRLDDAGSTLHRRDRFGVRELDGYYSVDTGKYSCAPWLARELAARIDASR
jgi:glycine/D-amino acid oxidase-like deaminating enzyme